MLVEEIVRGRGAFGSSDACLRSGAGGAGNTANRGGLPLVPGGGVSGGEAIQRVSVRVVSDPEGHPSRYTLTLGTETITLDPGRAWIQADAYKWVTRGLLEEPQSYHVAPEGTVEINGEKILLTDHEGIARLEHEINKHHAGSVLTPSLPKSAPRKPAGPPRDPTKVTFQVKIDRLSHLVIGCFYGEDHLETGLRGLTNLVSNGLMRKPRALHIDPLQRWIEIDAHRFECSEQDAHRFEAFLNAEYALKLKAAGEGVIEIKENPASATGLDIHFTSFHAGVRTEVKGHLTQGNLDLLQDDQKCDLLQHGIVLRLSPPNLLIRHRRPDGGEERVPDIPDVAYRRVKPAELQAIFNDPRLRRTGKGVAGAASAPAPHPTEFQEIRVLRNPKNRLALWLECVAAHSDQVEGMALTHHNVAELQHRGVFRPEFDVAMSVDAHELSVLNPTTREEDKIRLAPNSPDDQLVAAGRLLTGALKAPSTPPTPSVPDLEPDLDEPSAEEDSSSEQEKPSAAAPSDGPVSSLPLTTPVEEPSPAFAPLTPVEASVAAPISVPVESLSVSSRGSVTEEEPRDEPEGGGLFPDQDPRHVIEGVFSALTRHLEVPLQEVHLSLPRVFSDRRFVVLSFGGQQISGLGELRSDAFYGFYLSFLDPGTVILVYACQGRHIEWGTDKCVVQSSLSAEADEFKEPALLGLAQDADGNFLFMVTPAYRQWIRTREHDYRSVFARFLTADQFLAQAPRPMVIWPE